MMEVTGLPNIQTIKPCRADGTNTSISLHSQTQEAKQKPEQEVEEAEEADTGEQKLEEQKKKN